MESQSCFQPLRQNSRVRLEPVAADRVKVGVLKEFVLLDAVRTRTLVPRKLCQCDSATAGIRSDVVDVEPDFPFLI